MHIGVWRGEAAPSFKSPAARAEISRPVVHEAAPTLEEITAGVGRLGGALVRGCGQAYALQTGEPVTYRCGTRRVCQARSSGSERYTRARPHAGMFDATRGAHISPGELEHIWRGPPGPPADRSWPDPAGAWYCTGIDWAQKCDSTVAAVVRCETTPLQLVAVYRAQRRPWLSMTEKVGALLDEYPGTAAHDATGAGNAMGAFPALAAHDQLQGVTLVGRVRTDLFRNDIGAIERHEIVGPRIDACYTEHKYCGEDDLFGSGHPPDTVVALALAYHAFTTGRRPSDETPAGAPAGETR